MTVSRGIYVIVIGSHAKDKTNQDTLPIDASTCDVWWTPPTMGVGKQQNERK
jgi:hypothetical protein